MSFEVFIFKHSKDQVNARETLRLRLRGKNIPEVSLSVSQIDSQDPIRLDDYFPITLIVCTLKTSIFFLPAVTNVSIKSNENLFPSSASTAATNAVA